MVKKSEFIITQKDIDELNEYRKDLGLPPTKKKAGNRLGFLYG